MSSRKTFEALASSIHDLPDSTFTLPAQEFGPGIGAARTQARDGRFAVACAVADALCAESDSFDPIMFIRQATGTNPDHRKVAEFSTRLRLRLGLSRTA